MRKHFFFLCGSHCTGKTTILHRLKSKKVIDFNGSELGKDLFYSRKFQVDCQTDLFEREVTTLELERDKKIIVDDDIMIAASETWHPGNLAYAKVRNPHCVDDLLANYIKKTPLISSAQGIWLRIPWELIYKRTKTFADSPEWAADFYTEIDKKIEDSLKSLDLYERTTIISAEDDLADVESQVAQVISRQTGRKQELG
jgi:hypothetical protein